MALSLVRENTVAMRPPRALWVSFPLGRPFGAPGQPDLQRRVLAAALDLFERPDGHGILEDFPEDVAPLDALDMEGMVCPVPLPKSAPAGRSGHQTAVSAEIALLAPWSELAAQRRGRSTFGVTGLSLDDVIGFLAALAEGRPIEPASGLSLAQTLRFASEDLRTWYLDAAAARPGQPASPAAMANWFWGETAAGALILALHHTCKTSGDAELARLAERTLVPRTQMHRLRDA